MAVTQEQIDALTAAIGSGERQITYNGRTITYRSIDDLIKARDALRTELIGQSATARPKQSRLYYAGRGYDK
jgi:hypothetical protein